MVIDTSSQEFTSEYNGYIGLKPYTGLHNPDTYQTNALWRTKNNGYIDHIVIAFYIDKRKDVDSSIKIGGWDQIALAENAELEMFRCPTLSSWMLLASSV